MLDCCEKELLTQRRHLAETFLHNYCEDEYEKYNNYSNKKLEYICSHKGIVLPQNHIVFEVEQYDMLDGVMADVILSERGGE